ncbi:TlpA disulfide reductase family protein [Thiogranum longum]
MRCGRGLAGLLLGVGLCAAALADATTTMDEQLRAMQIDVPRERLPAPAFELENVDGGRIGLQDYRGSLVLLNFWATFCKPCRDEMPAMQALSKEFSDRGLVVLAIAADRGNKKAVEVFVREHGIDFPVPLDPDGLVRKQYEIDALPTSYLIGRDGRFVGRAVGERQWHSEQSKSLILKLLSFNVQEAPQR